MSVDTHHKEVKEDTLSSEEREELDDLILQNRTIEALIKGLEGDLEIFKQAKSGEWTPQDTVRFTMQRNIMKDKRERNLAAINRIIKENKEHNNHE